MRIGIISDTHMPKKAKTLPRMLLEGLRDVDLIIHAGDWTSLDIYKELELIAPVEGVYGNVDPVGIKQMLDDQKVLTLEGYKIGIVHGHLGKKKTTPERALEAFQHQKVDMIIFGHSHTPYKAIHNGTILFNPGSPTDKRFQPQFSYGIMEINDSIHVEHHYYHDKT